MTEPLDRFESDWIPRLNSGAKTMFKHASPPPAMGLHSAIADTFVAELGYDSIGFNWELLDAAAGSASSRAAIGEITSAIAKDISNPSKDWLGEAAGRQCAADLLNAFDANSLTVVSNRYDGLWNPISGALVEWGFVCFDDANIALLLITEA
ncbi:hypothetical protein [Erythrobacter crassostreae]|uniref:Uncharacterized protein n=1 Tax=Erythrobacter crassostreae TaxID=2828328 RepID=A0A9X1F1Y6_9SPHN|nr:hypothetical protein [Erythrobacter crassostrea]MBV7258807.1 hypothetical protein [Erythrobacter crassostrea]